MDAPGTGGAGPSGYGNTYSEKCKVDPFAVGCAAPPGEEPTMPPEVETPKPPARTPPKPTPAAEKPPSLIRRLWPFGTAAAKDSGSQQDAASTTPASEPVGNPAPPTEAASTPHRPENPQRPEGEPADKAPKLEAAKKRPPNDAPKEKPRDKEPKEKPTKKPEGQPDVSELPPGQRPCVFVGTGGEGLSRSTGLAGKIECRYICGRSERKYRYVWGLAKDADDLCRKKIPTW